MFLFDISFQDLISGDQQKDEAVPNFSPCCPCLFLSKTKEYQGAQRGVGGSLQAQWDAKGQILQRRKAAALLKAPDANIATWSSSCQP